MTNAAPPPRTPSSASMLRCASQCLTVSSDKKPLSVVHKECLWTGEQYLTRPNGKQAPRSPHSRGNPSIRIGSRRQLDQRGLSCSRTACPTATAPPPSLTVAPLPLDRLFCC